MFFKGKTVLKFISFPVFVISTFPSIFPPTIGTPISIQWWFQKKNRVVDLPYSDGKEVLRSLDRFQKKFNCKFKFLPLYSNNPKMRELNDSSWTSEEGKELYKFLKDKFNDCSGKTQYFRKSKSNLNWVPLSFNS
ncbi:hypothetical protein MHC_02785 [Mycoplasma haemocanis str. Illinois]|uniref:Uncharacterized protein n=1 Tax=Mycoplasma haemocanis (strain Illinois) TaxID=1111676 RepID=H6N6Z7_MYCHN|nr:hypothetical protein [Mycoplasma haemocanis]AEW45419.1 hypothetical protein MHC_02785 [Mycoplasma haemocanis str. Illinois]